MGIEPKEEQWNILTILRMVASSFVSACSISAGKRESIGHQKAMSKVIKALPPNSSSMTACSSNSLVMALDMLRNVPTDWDICDNWPSWCCTRCSCCRICCWSSSCVEAALVCDGDPVVASRLYLVFLMTLGTKLLWDVGLDNDTASEVVCNTY